MITNYDKIRILWIDDCEGQDAGYMYPEKMLPSGELERYFTIVGHPDIPGPSTIRTPKDFGTCFSPFWWGVGDTKLFPPEIIGMDYNLQKWIDTKVRVTEQSDEVPPYLMSGASKPSGVTSESGTSGRNNEWTAGFEGLVLGIFTSSLLHQHPIGIVPMTNYGDLLENVPEVRALHLISKEILHIDYSKFGVSGEDRSWEKVLMKGVKALRVRIEGLYESGQIVLSPSDLMILANDASHGVLTIRSPHALRRLPIQGLFMDIPEEKRDSAIHTWARELMRTVMVDCEELKQARELAGKVWEAYNNDEQVSNRKNLSLLASRKGAGKSIDETEYARLSEMFLVSKNRCRSSGCVDITSGNFSDRERRWAALLIALNMLRRLILIRKHVKTQVHKATGQTDDVTEGPFLSPADLFLALYPNPSSPLILPWHSGKNINHSFGWVKNMLRWKQESFVSKDIGDLALSAVDLLAGQGWMPEGPHGLTYSERLVLRGFALDDPNLSESDWRSYTKSNLVLWGLQGVAENV